MSTHAIYILPKTHSDEVVWSRIISQQKSLRLRALLQSPESFSSTYDREIAFSDQDWESRLRNPQAFTFIAGTANVSSDVKPQPSNDITNCNWVGNAVLFGPAPTHSDGLEVGTLEFHLYGLFVLPECQGNGLGKALVRAVIKHATVLARSQHAGAVRLNVSAVSSNERALGIYRSLGFVVIDDNDSAERDSATIYMALTTEVSKD